MNCALPFQRAEAAEAARPPAAAAASALDLTLRLLRPVLCEPEVTEVCINRPGEAFIETRYVPGAAAPNQGSGSPRQDTP